MLKHVNNGDCSKCDSLFDKFPNFHHGLRQWFKSVQLTHKDAHISEAGRGKRDQESYKKTGRSLAAWGQSAHNYNAAIDIFRQTQQGTEYDRTWFRDVIASAVGWHNATSDFKLNWYGAKGSSFYELPHVEIANWKLMGLQLVE